MGWVVGGCGGGPYDFSAKSDLSTRSLRKANVCLYARSFGSIFCLVGAENTSSCLFAGLRLGDKNDFICRWPE